MTTREKNMQPMQWFEYESGKVVEKNKSVVVNKRRKKRLRRTIFNFFSNARKKIVHALIMFCRYAFWACTHQFIPSTWRSCHNFVTFVHFFCHMCACTQAAQRDAFSASCTWCCRRRTYYRQIAEEKKKNRSRELNWTKTERKSHEN